jgi:hypothetical protein
MDRLRVDRRKNRDIPDTPGTIISAQPRENTLPRDTAIWHDHAQHQLRDKVNTDQDEQQRRHYQEQQRAPARLVMSYWLVRTKLVDHRDLPKQNVAPTIGYSRLFQARSRAVSRQ